MAHPFIDCHFPNVPQEFQNSDYKGDRAAGSENDEDTSYVIHTQLGGTVRCSRCLQFAASLGMRNKISN